MDIRLPSELAPQLRARVLALLDEVKTVERPPLALTNRSTRFEENRCEVCHQGGVLSGHHGPNGEIQWIHRSCHRRLHRRGLPAAALIGSTRAP